MFRVLFFLFLIVPLIEVALLIKIGNIIGSAYTIALIIGTAALGVVLLRRQSLATLVKFRRNLDQGRLPAIELVEGLILLVAGALLLTPGFVTDIFGFLLLIPETRKRIANVLLANFIVKQTDTRRTGKEKIIEAEYWEEKK